jgi:hypothetical protein
MPRFVNTNRRAEISGLSGVADVVPGGEMMYESGAVHVR